MLIDARTLADGTTIQADVCIIGAGPAGLTIAKQLGGKGLRIAVIESGGEDFDPDIQELADGEFTGIEPDPLDATRYIALGGTATVWNGHCRRLDEMDFRARSWVPRSGWPFDRSELSHHYDTALDLLDLDPPDFDVGNWAERTGQRPIDVDGDTLFHRMSLVRPFRFWSSWGEALTSSADVAVHSHATVLAIRLAGDGRRVERLDLATLDGKRMAATARRYVIAGGGIANPRLLLLSNDVHGNGIGNQNDLVGRFFMEHPRFVSGQLLLSGEPYPIKGLYHERYLGNGMSVLADWGIRPEVQERERICNFLGRLDPVGGNSLSEGGKAVRHIVKALRNGALPHNFSEVLWEAISDFDGVVADTYHRLVNRGATTHTFEIESYVEQSPNPDSRVRLSDRLDPFGRPMAHLIWDLSELDKWTAYRGIELVAQAVGAKDVGRVRIEVERKDVFPPTTGWGHHHMGTTRMHDDPKQGVVNHDCQVHGVSNLFVAGSSVFPTSGTATPTLTIVALAARLADHLLKTGADET